VVSYIRTNSGFHKSETRNTQQIKDDVERIRQIEKDRIIQWLKEGKDDDFIMVTLIDEYNKLKPFRNIDGLQELHKIAQTIVGVVLITKDEYHGKPHAGYNEEGYYQGGIPE